VTTVDFADERLRERVRKCRDEVTVQAALLVAAGVLALVYGSNAGATIAATSLRVGGGRLWLALLALGCAIAVAPLALGTAVATTVAHELVPSGGDPAADRVVFLAAVVAALVVTAVLSRWGQPTSLTLALIAGIAGAGLGAGQAMGWSAIARVLVLVAVAPFVGLVLAAALHRLSAAWRCRRARSGGGTSGPTGCCASPSGRTTRRSCWRSSRWRRRRPRSWSSPRCGSWCCARCCSRSVPRWGSAGWSGPSTAASSPSAASTP